ncbi:MAG: hypothetical protein ACFFBP_17390 [Promethearchaeota archaeon]
MKIQNKSLKLNINLKKKSPIIIFTIFLGIMIISPTTLILKDHFNEIQERPIFLKKSATIDHTGIYKGEIGTMGMKIEEFNELWSKQNKSSNIIQQNKTYNEFIYTLNRLDIRAYNLYNGSGVIDIATNDSVKIDIGGIPIPFGYIVAQEFTTPSTSDLLAIDKVSLYLKHSFPPIVFRSYLYFVYIANEDFSDLLGGAIVPLNAADVDGWIAFNISSNILDKDTKYHLLYFLAVKGLAGDDYSVYNQNTWLAENKSVTGNENQGGTYIYNGTDYEPILNDSSIDMLCNYSYQKIINPEKVDLKCKINDVEFTPNFQKSLSTGTLGYEAILIHNFDHPQIEDINITIYTNDTIDSLEIEIKQYYIHAINASGVYEISGDIITWNITYQYYDIGAYKEELWFLYESDWELDGFYNTIGTPIEVYFGPISLYNKSYYGLFDLWGTPLGIGDCTGIFRSPNYCNNINTKMKEGEIFQDKGYIQLGKTIKFEAEIKNALNEPISGGSGNITFKNSLGDIIYQESNLTSYNGILNSSEIMLDTSYDVGIYTVDIFWTNGKEVAIYTISIEVRHPEGYIPPETIILIASLIGLAILATPASLVARKYIRQRNWEKSLSDLFVLTKDGVSMYNFSFGIELRRPELITGMISALSTFMKEATGSKEGLRTIDQQDKKIILNHGEFTTVALIGDKDLPIIHKRVKKFTDTFENKYGKRLLNWSGEITMFKDAEPIVTKFFPVSMEEQRIRGVKMKLVEFRERLLTVDDPMQIISIMREITDFSSRYQEIINRYSFKDFNELIRIAEQKIQGN